MSKALCLDGHQPIVIFWEHYHRNDFPKCWQYISNGHETETFATLYQGETGEEGNDKILENSTAEFFFPGSSTVAL